MMTQSRMYYVKPFLVITGMMKGEPLTSTIFNIVVEVVIPLWYTVVTVVAAVLEGFSRAVQTLYALICVVGRLLASKTPARIQAELDVLTGLFDHVGVQKMSSVWWA